MSREAEMIRDMNRTIQEMEEGLRTLPEENRWLVDKFHEMLGAAKAVSFMDMELGIYNMNNFMKCVGDCMNAGKIGQYAACFFNIRRMSIINSQIGRDNGTKLLKKYLTALQGLLQADGCVCRLSGDNFLMLFHKEKVFKVTEYLEESIVELNDSENTRITMGTHAGYYMIPADCSGVTEIMDRISMAFNTAKYIKRIPKVFFNDEIKESIEKEKKVESKFAEGIEKEEFLVYYQPKVSLHNYQLVGAEALCRWQRGDELIPPGQFIPVLERSSLICTLDFYMLEHVCRDISRWIREGKPVVKVSINLSRVHLGDPDLLRRVIEIVDKYDVPHRYIEIELTETTTDVDFMELKNIVTGFRMQGLSVSIDDFGVGYSSLNLIREIPWNVLKIDRSFLQMSKESDDEDAQKKVVLKHIIGMAQNLGLECIAEGVENIEQVALLKENNCYNAQGYLFDRPLPCKEFEERLEGQVNSLDALRGRNNVI